MKIGILTFHRSLNYGAFIQAYSLSERLKKDFPTEDVEIVDYSVKCVQNVYSEKALTFVLSPLALWRQRTLMQTLKRVAKNLITVCSDKAFLKKRAEMKRAFADALKGISLSSDALCTDDHKKVTKWLQDRYDILVVGSDCVWEFNHYPFPNIYFLHDIKNTAKMSYAACAQGILADNLTDTQKKYLRESWEQFDYLGVRDWATDRLVRSVYPQASTHHNCDPTVFLDMDHIPVDMQALKRKFELAGVDFTRPVACLMGNEYVGKACKAALPDHYQIVAVFEKNAYADCFVPDLTPFEWAKCFALFDITFTNRFHGTILSLKNGTPPITFDFAAEDHSFSNQGNTKIRDVYERFQLLENHYFIGKREYSEAELQAIREAAKQALETSERENIKRGIETEEAYYSDFSAHLSRIIETKKQTS